MNSRVDSTEDQFFNKRLATSGFRFTPQRQHVYNVLRQDLSHPTAEEIFLCAKQEMPEISIATVYNCLDALVKSGLVRQVHVDRAASRFCPNMQDHGHFYCEECGGIFDISVVKDGTETRFEVPSGFQVHHYEVSIRGLCPGCGPRSNP